MLNDWIYSDDRMKLRQECLSKLLNQFGRETIPNDVNEKIYECAHDWISQGNKTTSGILKYFVDNYQ